MKLETWKLWTLAGAAALVVPAAASAFVRSGTCVPEPTGFALFAAGATAVVVALRAKRSR